MKAHKLLLIGLIEEEKAIVEKALSHNILRITRNPLELEQALKDDIYRTAIIALPNPNSSEYLSILTQQAPHTPVFAILDRASLPEFKDTPFKGCFFRDPTEPWESVIQVVEQAQNVSDESAQAHNETEKLFQKVLDILPVGVWIMDKNGTIQLGNPMAQRIWGGAKYVGPNQFEVYKGWKWPGGEPIQSHEWAAARAIERGETSLEELIEIEGFDGKHRIILNSAIPIRDKEGRITGAIVVNQDISARVHAEKALEKSKAELNAILESISDAFFSFDSQLNLTYFNRAAETLLGTQRKDLLGRSLFEAFPKIKGTIFEEKFRQALEEKRFIAFEAHHPPFREWYEVRVYPRSDGISVYFQSSTERRKAEAALHKMKAELEERVMERTSRLARTGRALRVLAETNRILNHANEEKSLLKAICQAIIDLGGYRFAWVGYAEHDPDQSIRVMAHAGLGEEYLKNKRFSWKEGAEEGQGPGGSTIRSGKPTVAKDILKDPNFRLWRKAAIEQGFGSSISLPLTTDHQTRGFLAVYAAEPDAFDEEEVKMLKELAENLSFGITSLRSRAERKQAEEALREVEERFKAAFEYAFIGMGLIDLEGRWLRVNRALCELTGYALEELLSKTYMDITHPEDLKQNQALYEQLYKGEVPAFQMEKRYIHKSGRIIWILLSATLVRDSQGKGLYAVSQIQDITENKQTVEALRKSEEKFYKSFRSSPQVMFILRLSDGRLVEVNDTFIQLSGFSREEAIGHSSLEIGLITEKDFASLRQSILSQGSVRNREIKYRTKSGEEREGLISEEVIEIGTTQYILGLINDITDLRRSIRETHRLQKQQIETLKQADRIKDEFLSVISHELRTPLNGITGFASLLEDEIAGSLTPQQHEFLGRILKSADRMLALIDDLLDFARMQAGHLEITREPTDYAQLIREVLDSFEAVVEEKGIGIATEVKVDGPVEVDRRRIFQVLANLISNSLKFTDRGGKIRIRAYQEKNQLVTEVEDNGKGISEADLPKLFSPFRQLDMGLTRQVGGIGLGLSISKGIIRAHGGCIEAESPGLGRGSTFRFKIPLT